MMAYWPVWPLIERSALYDRRPKWIPPPHRRKQTATDRTSSRRSRWSTAIRHLACCSSATTPKTGCRRSTATSACRRRSSSGTSPTTPGAAELTRRLAADARAPAVLSTFSRLLIDANRGEDDPTLIMRLSDGAIVPGNASRWTRRSGRGASPDSTRPTMRSIAAAVDAAIASGRRPGALFRAQLHAGLAWRAASLACGRPLGSRSAPCRAADRGAARRSGARRRRQRALRRRLFQRHL